MTDARPPRNRMAASLSLLVVTNVVVAAGALRVLALAVPGLSRRGLAAVFILGLAATFAVEYLYLRLSMRHVGGGDGGIRHPRESELSAVADRLAAQLDVPAPSVRVVRADRPNSFTIGGLQSGTVVLTTGLVEALDDDQLRAVLAHELAHLRNRDALLVSMAAALPALTDWLFPSLGGSGVPTDEIPRSAWAMFERSDDDSVLGTLVAIAAMVLVVVAVLRGLVLVGLAGYATLAALVSPMWAPGFAVLGRYTLLSLPVLAVATLSAERELAADRAAARLTGDPAALATALERLYEGTEAPRVTPGYGVAVLTLTPRPLDLAATDADLPFLRRVGRAFDGTLVGRFGDPDYHPSLARRRSALAALTEELERR